MRCCASDPGDHGGALRATERGASRPPVVFATACPRPRSTALSSRARRAVPWIAVLVWIVLLTADAGSRSRDAVSIEEIAPARSDTALVCRIRTAGLPDSESRETMESGLPSALVIAFSLLDGAGDEIGGSNVEIRLEPDLWEGTLMMRTPLADHRVSSLSELEERLKEIGPLPVFPLSGLDPEDAMKLRARLAVLPLAPTESRRVRELFGGPLSADDPVRREVSVGLGSLIRFFLGQEAEGDWAAEATSPAFRLNQLARAE